MISVFISSALQHIALKETGQQVSDFPFSASEYIEHS